MRFETLRQKVQKIAPNVSVEKKNGCVQLFGELEDYATIVRLGKLAHKVTPSLGVLNDIVLKGFIPTPHLPTIEDRKLEGLHVDVLIVGGGVTGCAIARALRQRDYSVLLVEKESDLAMAGSSHNGGVVHVGIDMGSHPIKQSYCIRGNALFPQTCQDLGVPFLQKGQCVLLQGGLDSLLKPLLKHWARKYKIPAVRALNRQKALEIEPHLPSWCKGMIHMGTGGIVSPYELTFALGENAAMNGARFSFDTVVRGMHLDKGNIVSVETNRGTLYPRLVINAAGVHADEIAEMAGDRTFTIHPRKGTDIILAKTVHYLAENTSYAPSPITDLEVRTKNPFIRIRRLMEFQKNHVSKGLGFIHTIDGNVIIGPDAIEQPDKEDQSRSEASLSLIFEKQKRVQPELSRNDMITSFAGERAATYEEDFTVRKGLFCNNIFEAAGIQSPGLTAAPAIAEDMLKWADDFFEKTRPVTANPSFNPCRPVPIRMAELSLEERNALIHQSPAFGHIVCLCENISEGEVVAALSRPLCPPSVDAVKRRCRPGMGKCQGGFCEADIVKIIARERNLPLNEVMKNNDGSPVLLQTLNKGQ